MGRSAVGHLAIFMRGIRLWMLVAVWCAATVAAAGQGSAETLSLSQVTTTIAGQSSAQQWQLPYAWDKLHSGQQGTASFDLQFSAQASPEDPWALYLPKLGNAYEVWLNGALLQRQGDLALHNSADYAHLPRIVTIPPELLRTTNHLRILIRADQGRKGGLAPPVVGPQSAVMPLYEGKYLMVGVGSMLVAVFSLGVGVLALVLWLTQPEGWDAQGVRRNPLYLYAALAELFWSFGVGYVLVAEPPIAWPWWGVLTVAAGVAWRCNMLLFSMEVLGWNASPGGRWFRRWLWTLLVAMPILVASTYFSAKPWVLSVGYLFEGLTTVVFSVYFLRHAMSQPLMAPRMLALAIFINVLVGFRDLYFYRINPEYSDFTLLRYSSVLFGLTLVFIVVSRFRAVSAQARELMETLSARVAQKETELANAWQHTEHLVREQERAAERTRILRDMHDGVGSHISTAIRQLQSGQSGAEAVLQTLRDSLDQLKLSIDAMNLPPGDVNALLANLRYRLEPRFLASDMVLQWEVDLLPILAHLDAGAMRQLQFMLFEAFSNILQHAHARLMRLEAHAELPAVPGGARVVRVRVVDDGVGFDVQSPQRRGLAAMHARAAAIGGQLRITSQPGRTVVEIRLA